MIRSQLQSTYPSSNTYDKARIVTKTENWILELPQPKSRNACLALLKLHSERFNTSSESLKLSNTCRNYFEEYSTKIACFQDLQPYLMALARNHQEVLIANVTRQRSDQLPPGLASKAGILVCHIAFEFIADYSQAEYTNAIVSEINSLKIEYCLIISRSQDSQILISFVNLSLRLYNTYLPLNIQLPQSDRGLVDDAVILAAMALMQMYNIGYREAILQCLVILENLLSHSKHNYDAILILVRLYMYLGMGSMAMDRYARLSIKNVQHATMSWVLVTRLSTIHPWPSRVSFSDRLGLDPLEELEEGLVFHCGSTNLTNKALSSMVAKKQWNMIIGLLKTQGVIQNGFGFALLKAELLRIRRLRALPRDRKRKISAVASGMIQDNRDYTSFPNFRPIHQATFEHSLPGPSSQLCLNPKWLNLEYDLARLWDFIDGQNRDLQESGKLRGMMRNIQAGLDESFKTWQPHDSHIISLLVALLPLTDIAFDITITQRRVSTLLDEVSKQLVLEHRRASTWAIPEVGSFLLSDDRQIPIWITFHHAFTLIERIDFITRFLDKCMTKDHLLGFAECGELSEKVLTMRKRCQEIRETVHSGAKHWLTKVSLIPFEDLLKSSDRGLGQDEVDSGEELCNLVGAEKVKSICMMFRESYADALDGIIRSSAP